MSILIVLAAIVSLSTFSAVRGRAAAFLLAVTTTFTLWIWLTSVLPHPLVDWKEHFVNGALLVAGTVAFMVGGLFEITKRLRKA